MTNQLYYGDNLDILRRKIASGSVDLCYIDPPFNSKRNYFQIYNNQGGAVPKLKCSAPPPPRSAFCAGALAFAR